MSFFAFSMDFFSSNERRASTSVETLPGMSLRISQPNSTNRCSRTFSASGFPFARAFFTKCKKRGSCDAVSRSEGLVVVSCGRHFAIASTSPESATMTEKFFKDSSAFAMCNVTYPDNSNGYSSHCVGGQGYGIERPGRRPHCAHALHGARSVVRLLLR